MYFCKINMMSCYLFLNAEVGIPLFQSTTCFGFLRKYFHIFPLIILFLKQGSPPWGKSFTYDMNSSINWSSRSPIRVFVPSNIFSKSLATYLLCPWNICRKGNQQYFWNRLMHFKYSSKISIPFESHITTGLVLRIMKN